MLKNKRTWRIDSRWWNTSKNEFINGIKPAKRYRRNNEFGTADRLFSR
jgi:hypothetical protein